MNKEQKHFVVTSNLYVLQEMAADIVGDIEANGLMDKYLADLHLLKEIVDTCIDVYSFEISPADIERARVARDIAKLDSLVK